jgi:hypothetical protein
MNSTWLLVAEKYGNAWTKSITHFDHWTTSGIESGHAFIKSHLLGPNHSFTSVIKMLTNALKSQVHKILAHYHQQKINSLQSIGKIFDNCHGRITHHALRKAQKNLVAVASLEKTAACNGFHFERTGIPCKHCLKELIDSKLLVEPYEFHPQWHIKVSFSLFFFFFIFFGRGALGVVG